MSEGQRSNGNLSYWPRARQPNGEAWGLLDQIQSELIELGGEPVEGRHIVSELEMLIEEIRSALEDLDRTGI